MIVMKKNKFKDFIINNNTLCSKVNNVNCLYDINSYEYL